MLKKFILKIRFNYYFMDTNGYFIYNIFPVKELIFDKDLEEIRF